jgi:hypothetical protein
MTDLYLKFADEAEANSVLMQKIVTSVEDDVVTGFYEIPRYANIDTIGIIYEPQEIVDPENPPEPIPLEGWHVNVRVVGAENAEPLQPFAVVPESPRRVWG